MSGDRDEELYNVYGSDRIAVRQIDELIGLVRGLCADGVLNDAEVEFLQKWLVINHDITGQPLVSNLCHRVNQMLSDGVMDEGERRELFDALNSFSDTTFELGEVLKPTTLPLCSPPPDVTFPGMRFCFTGTFNLGRRRDCEGAVEVRGGLAGSLTQDTDYLVIGAYVTDSWLHSTCGTKIIKAVEMRDDKYVPISIVSEEHWARFL
jgi:NAD-dependent DNA ligase